jgi:type 1 fimbriae regulatory protein FimB/type 1 fimbriae regulatory protein FimE
MNTRLRLVAPTTEKRTIATPRRQKNAELRTREHLSEGEIERLMEAARKNNREGHRDALMILMAYRHGLRASELCDLQWSQVDFNGSVIHIRRVKNGNPATHPLTGKELRPLRRLEREAPTKSAFVFVSMRGTPFTVSGFRRMLERAAIDAGLEALKVHPHMLRHAAGYQLANQGTDTRTIQAYLGHRNIANTVRYTELSAGRFKGLFRD